MTTSFIFTNRSALDTAVEAWITDEANADGDKFFKKFFLLFPHILL